MHAARNLLYVLSRYALERLLYRLGRSPFADQFVVKGALLFALWRDHPHRPTRDLDLLAFGSEDADRIRQVFNNQWAPGGPWLSPTESGVSGMPP